MTDSLLDVLDLTDMPEPERSLTLPLQKRPAQGQREGAHDALFSALYTRLYARAYRLLANRADAQDVVQEAFLRWHAARDLALQVPAAWLHTVVTRLAIDRLRLQRKWMSAEMLDEARMADEVAGLTEASSPLERIELHEALGQAVDLMLQRLGREECQVLLLREVCELDYAALAQRLGRTPAHCRQLLHRARKRLQQGPARGVDDRARRAEVVPALVDSLMKEDAVAVLAWVDLAYRGLASGVGVAPAAVQCLAPGGSAAAGKQCPAKTNSTVGAILAAAALIARLRAGMDTPVL